MAAKKELEKEEIFRRIEIVLNKFLMINRLSGSTSEIKITLKTDLYGELGMDSVEIMDFIAAIEEEFSIAIDARDFTGKKTVEAIVDYLAM